MSNVQISSVPFGQTPDGMPVELYTLRNAGGMAVKVMTYGAIVTSIRAPDRQGRLGEVVMGFDTLADYTSDAYLKGGPYLGATIGRYGNRIAGGKFSLNGRTFQLARNNGPNSLHGGIKGFDKVVWAATAKETPAGPALVLTYASKDGEENYPGNLAVSVTYSLDHANALRIDFAATTDRDTVVNLTHHSYFNLRGSGDILDHVVSINADQFTPVDATLIPTGELRSVAGTPFDFRAPTAVGARIDSDDEQIKIARGYDTNWVLNKTGGRLSLAATACDPASGRMMEVHTTSPGMQFYTGNFLNGAFTGPDGWVFQFRNGMCFEPQHFPDSPNQPAFPTTVLKPGEVYQNTIIYQFSTQ